MTVLPPGESAFKVETGLFWPILRNPKSYFCPADGPHVPGFAKRQQQISSYVMNGAVNGCYRATNTALVIKLGEIPPGGMVYWEANEQSAHSFNDGASRPDERGQYLLRYSPRTQRTMEAGRIPPAHPGTFEPRSNWQDDSPTFLAWESGWPRPVILSDDGLNTFYSGTLTNLEAQRLAWGGGVTVHSRPNGDHLWIIGQPSNQPPGVWDYVAATGDLDCIVPGLELPLRQARYVTPVYDRLTNAAGELRGYCLWPPARVNPQKKYPLILGQTVNSEWLPFEQVAANCGYYFAVVHRPYWLSKRLGDWPADVMSLYAVLARNPNVDTNRVFLWGHSAETPYVARLLREQAPLWRGALLSSPGGWSELESLRDKRLLIMAGMNNHAADGLTTYQDRALEAGVRLKLYLQEDAGHNPMSVRKVRERTQVWARFLAEDL